MAALSMTHASVRWENWQYHAIKRRIRRAARRGHHSTRVLGRLCRTVHDRLTDEGFTLAYAVFLWGPYVIMW